nr:MAG TPA: tail assembly chaperone [Caudovirales sp. ctMlE25]
MSEEKKNIANAKNVVLNETVEQGENLVLEFHKPYIFEGKSYDSVDLSPLENITGEMMIEIERECIKKGIVILQEMSLNYAQLISSRVTGIPIEFFTGLDAKDSNKLKNLVSNFMYAEE